MPILRRNSEDTVSLHFPLRMDETTNAEIREVLDEVLEGDDRVVILELSDTEYLNSSAVGLLLAFVANIRKGGRTCRLGGISGPAKKILEAMRILHHLTVSPTTGD